MNLDFLEKISSEQRKRIAIKFIRRKKGNVLKKIRNILIRIPTHQRKFDDILAEYLVTNDQRREVWCINYLCKKARSIQHFHEVLENVVVQKEQKYKLLDKMYTAFQKSHHMLYYYQDALLTYIQKTNNIPSYKKKHDEMYEVWLGNIEITAVDASTYEI